MSAASLGRRQRAFGHGLAQRSHERVAEAQHRAAPGSIRSGLSTLSRLATATPSARPPAAISVARRDVASAGHARRAPRADHRPREGHGIEHTGGASSRALLGEARARGVGLDAAPAAAGAPRPVDVHPHVAEFTGGVAGPAPQAPVDTTAAADAGADDDDDEAPDVAALTEVPLRHRGAVAVVVDLAPAQPARSRSRCREGHVVPARRSAPSRLDHDTAVGVHAAACLTPMPATSMPIVPAFARARARVDQASTIAEDASARRASAPPPAPGSARARRRGPPRRCVPPRSTAIAARAFAPASAGPGWRA